MIFFPVSLLFDVSFVRLIFIVLCLDSRYSIPLVRATTSVRRSVTLYVTSALKSYITVDAVSSSCALRRVTWLSVIVEILEIKCWRVVINLSRSMLRSILVALVADAWMSSVLACILHVVFLLPTAVCWWILPGIPLFSCFPWIHHSVLPTVLFRRPWWFALRLTLSFPWYPTQYV